MSTTLYTGYFALGTASGTTFTEVTGTGYARVAGSLVTASANRHTNAAVATFTASAGDWSGAVTQIAVWTASSSGTNRLFWNLPFGHTIANGESFTIAALGLNLLFADSFYRTGATATFATHDILGHDAGGDPIYAGSAMIVHSGVVQSASPLVYAATGIVGSSDPHVVGALWLNSSVLTISAG